MLRRVAAASTDRSASQVWGGTFHSTANRVLRTFGQQAGLSPGFTVLDQSDSTDLMGLIRTEEGLGERAKRFPRKETVASIYSRMVSSGSKLTAVLDSEYPWCIDHTDGIRTVFSEYTLRKRSHNVLDYDDLLLFWRGLTVGAAGDGLRGLFDHILIDEYQDTNPMQSDIIRGMFRPDTDLCAVGDDAQAIYGFRAATVENMWEFDRHFPGATRITLEQNYRSTQPILAVANAVLAQSDEHFSKDLWSEREGGLRPKLRTHHDEATQAQSVATAVLDARERGIDLRQQAVLFRAGHHSDGLELELTRRDIPYVKYGGLKYLESGHIKDLLALLRVLDNPADQLAWHRVLATMDGVGPATIRRLFNEIGLEDDSNDALARFIDGAGSLPGAAATQAAELRSALAYCTDSDPPPSQQIDRLTGFCSAVFPNRYDNGDARLADVQQLATTASEYRSRSRFLTELTLDPASKTSDQAGAPHLDDDWLTLSTIHSAKGLEWRSVHLLHAADGNMPSDMALSDDAGLAEELRLMYVALTRAKDELTVNFPLRFHVNRRATDDRHVYAQLSRFIEPICELFDQQGPHSSEAAAVDVHAGGPCTVGVSDEVDTMLAALLD
jgi:DNA helicase-2/ATP-dependent DNA helicase PcrA